MPNEVFVTAIVEVRGLIEGGRSPVRGAYVRTYVRARSSEHAEALIRAGLQALDFTFVSMDEVLSIPMDDALDSDDPKIAEAALGMRHVDGAWFGTFHTWDKED